MQGLQQTLQNLQAQIKPSLPAPQSETCETCRGTGWEFVAGKGARECGCRLRKEHDDRVAKLLAATKIPPMYRNFRLETLAPRLDRHPEQGRKIEFLRANPFLPKIYLHGARKGAGKTTMGWSLLIHSALAGLPVYGLNTSDLVDELRLYEIKDVAPRLLPAFLEIEPINPELPTGTIFLDEFDKANATEFTSRKILQILDKAVAWNWQLIIASNLNPDDIQTLWSKHSDVYGKAIGRRAIEDTQPIDFN